MLARQRLDRQGEICVPRQRPMHVLVGAQDVRQYGRVPRVGLAPRLDVPLPISSHGSRIDRIDGEAGTGQGDDEQVLVRLDRYGRLFRAAAIRRDQLDQRRVPGHICTDPGAGEDLALLVHQSDVVMVLGPVDPAGDAHASSFVGFFVAELWAAAAT